MPWTLAALIVVAAAGELAAQSTPALFPITVDDKHGMIDRTGTVVIPPEYAEPVIFRDGLARVAKGSKVAYLDATGRAAVKVDDKYGYIDKTGALVIPATLDRPMKFAEALAVARVGKQYGYIDRAGAWAIPPRFSWARPFHRGLAWVGEPGSRGSYVDTTGKVVWTAR